MIRATVNGSILLDGLPTTTYERLIRQFSFQNPKFGLAIAMKRSTAGIPEMIQAAVECPEGLRVPRGAIERVRHALAGEGIHDIRFFDQRSVGIHIGVCAEPVSLRPYQERVVAELASKTQGTVVIACGGGKTRCGVAAIQRLRRSTIVLVHTRDLLDQWMEQLRTLLNIEPGTVCEGKANYKNVTVALVQTLIGRTDDQELSQFGLCICDEAHHVPSSTLQTLLPCIPAKWRVGLTATPEREDRLTRLMDWSFGPRLIEVTASELIRMGYLMRPTLEVIETNFSFSYQGSEARRNAALTKQIIADEARNRRIVDVATRDAKAGETVVILSNSRAHCRALGKMCTDAGVECAVLIAGASKRSKELRQKTMERLRSGDLRLAIATSLFDEGIDIERLSRIVLALPARAKGATEQRIGRLMRVFSDKEPKLYDLVDARVNTLMRRWQSRKRVYKELGLIS